MSTAPFPIFTIGHSNHAVEIFLDLLRQHAIDAIADVRSSPYSRHSPQFNRELLEQELKQQGIRYVFLGQELGARPADQSCYDNGKVSFVRLAQTELFKTGLARVLQGSQRYRIALMCAEKEPLDCHRTILVARSLVAQGASVQHILADGRLESYESALRRLLPLVGLPTEDLFQPWEQLATEALTRQSQRIAYIDDKLTDDIPGDQP